MPRPKTVCWPKTSPASWASTVGTPLLYGVACVTCASQEIPATSEPRITPSITSTLRALRPSGGRNALTALDTASMPVSEEPPLANAREQDEDHGDRDQAARCWEYPCTRPAAGRW